MLYDIADVSPCWEKIADGKWVFKKGPPIKKIPKYLDSELVAWINKTNDINKSRRVSLVMDIQNLIYSKNAQQMAFFMGHHYYTEYILACNDQLEYGHPAQDLLCRPNLNCRAIFELFAKIRKDVGLRTDLYQEGLAKIPNSILYMD